MTLTFGVTVYIEIIILTECTSYNRTENYAEEHTRQEKFRAEEGERKEF